ncbi:MAG: pyruvate ferredoxin oxidoreductase [Candidatus Eiseniibacteriota bacterium]|nr:MAG: pyruvate ferredoxin oxidoreductase [Candidatus Eisenbacteria bacterium]
MRQVDPDVVAAYPITPQTELMERFAEFVSDGIVKTELVLVESEHSAMSACVGASGAGSRVMTATSANGLALMWEMLYIAASCRCPIVMTVVNRALSGPINIHCDHSDSMGARDAGWIHLFSENSQEAYDNTLQAVRIAEHPDVSLPVMVTLDGFIISHTLERVEILEDEQAKKFVGDFSPKYSLLDVQNPVTMGPLDFHDFYFEHKRLQVQGMENARHVVREIGKEYGALSGRDFDYFESYRMEDAELAVVALGSAVGTARGVVDELRDEGKRVGLLKLRVFRPFPRREIVELLRGLKAFAVMDRSNSFGSYGGPVFSEVRSACYGQGLELPIVNYVYGLGGRDTTFEDIRRVYQEIEQMASSGKAPDDIRFLNVRE